MVSNDLVLSSFPNLVSGLLLFLEVGKEISLPLLIVGAGSFSSDSVGVETSLFLDLPCVPLSFNFDKGGLKSFIKSSTFLVFNFSSSGKSLVKGMLDIVVPDGSNSPSDFLLFFIKSSNFNDVSLSNFGSCISECLINGLSSGFKCVSPSLIHVVDVGLHSGLLDCNGIIEFTKSMWTGRRKTAISNSGISSV